MSTLRQLLRYGIRIEWVEPRIRRLVQINHLECDPHAVWEPLCSIGPLTILYRTDS